MLAALLLSWIAMSLISTYATFRYFQLMEQVGTPSRPARAVVIVPIKGKAAATEAFLSSLFRQSHGNFRLLFSVETAADPAVPFIRAAAAISPSVAFEIVDAGLSVGCGQKVWNQLAALKCIRDSDELVVFADSDVILPATWLETLDWAVNDQAQEIVTGYRLLFPSDRRLSSGFAASMNLSVAICPRVTGLTAAWGGTMAMTRTTLARLDLPRWWQGALSDDLRLTAAARAQGILIHTNRATLLSTPWSGSFVSFLEFGGRQFRILRLNEALLFFGMVSAIAIPVAGSLVALTLAFSGEAAGWLALAAVLGLGLVRQRYRQKIVARVLPAHELASLGLWRLADGFGRAVWWPLLLLIGLAGSWGRTVTWAGTTYRCDGPNATRPLSRS
ncbi:MAG: glycosyltransferase [Rhizobiales bacterium]|nr:glycosyltransferase [Hyphomicrobiales bacterium]